MPTEAALVTMVALTDKFKDEPFEPALYWFLQASRFARYSGSGTTSLEEDLRDVSESDSQNVAVRKLIRRFPDNRPLEYDDFMRDYADSRFGRFLLYLLAYRNKAQDWEKGGDCIGFEGADVLADFRPQWHHIFPTKLLERLDPAVTEDKINALANIAVIGPKINIRISAKQPMDYIKRYEITSAKLAQQYIEEDIEAMQVTKKSYEDWLNKRAQRLVKAGNAFFGSLKKDL